MTTENQIVSSIEAMTQAFHQGDVDGILRVYEPAAVVVAEPGVPVRGDGPLREMFAGFVAAQARFTFAAHEVIVADDIGLHLTPWKMTGTAPDGSPITASGLSVAVLRRQADGRWLLLIDNPYGDACLQQPTGNVRESAGEP